MLVSLAKWSSQFFISFLCRTCSSWRLADVAGLLLCLELLHWTGVARLIKHFSHVSLDLVGFLQFVQQLGLFQFQFLRNLIGIRSVILFVSHPILVTTFQILLVQVTHGVEVRFCPHLRVLDTLEFPLIFFQELYVIGVNHIIDSTLLVLNIVISSSIRLERAFHALHNARLGVNTVVVEFSSVMFLCVVLEVAQVRHLGESGALLVIHI